MTDDNNDTVESIGWKNRLFVGLQYFLPQIALTRLIGWLTSRETVWLKNLAINGFVRAFSVNVREASEPVPDGYGSLNAFFTRELKAGARPVDEAPGAIVSPCDGVISQFGRISNGRLMQAKGFRYDSTTLLQDATLAKRFDDGLFMTIYLAPYDYHRVHMPVSGRIAAHRHVPGALFSVNQATAAAVPRLFSRNERRVFHIDGEFDMAMVMVGALNVGSISTVWDGIVTAGSIEQPHELGLPPAPLARGDTVGWFNMGSTVIMLLPPSAAEWLPEIVAGDVLRTGQKVGMAATA